MDKGLGQGKLHHMNKLNIENKNWQEELVSAAWLLMVNCIAQWNFKNFMISQRQY